MGAITFLNLLTATGMPPPRALYHSIRLVRRIQMVSFPTRSDRWLWGYHLLCTFVFRAGTFRFIPAECYKQATASSFIPLNSPRRAESNKLSPNPGGRLAKELSFSLTFSFPGIMMYLPCVFCYMLLAFSRSLPYLSSDLYLSIALINKLYSFL